MNYLKLTPLDSWFFRDGRPFHQGEPSADVESIFPPSAFTIAGAIRAHLARKMGWRCGNWNEKIIKVLGDGYNLGPLSFRGPFLGIENKETIKPLFPVPLHLLGKFEEGKGNEFILLSPGDEIECDLGKVRLPSAKGIEGMKTLKHYYLTSESLAKVLQGTTDDLEIIASKDLWGVEYAVGLARDKMSRTAKEGHLYSSCKVRLNDANGTCLLFGSEGIKDGLDNQFVFPIGGESRMAVAEVVDIQKEFLIRPNLQIKDGCLRFTVTHITPAWFDRWPGSGKGLPEVPGRVISACLERSLRIGGWSSVKGERDNFIKGPVALKPFIRPGSTWFCEACEDDKEDVLQIHSSRIGEYNDFGFGEVAIGAW
ncbi:MAG: CRISPR system Cmr subunit Cmr3 [Euryarchaeota archaeon ADurb.Bin190]|nr:MAG: CRISPR system Cmr subunit Cmr3 [Euryarchaeota archaeon ADurb.Bin190]